MSVTLIGSDDSCRLVFEGPLTFEFASEMEDRIITALRRYTRFEIDLSAVSDIDLCGLHLLRLLQGVGGKDAVIVAHSPLVQQASRRLLATRRGNSPRGDRRDANTGNDAGARKSMSTDSRGAALGDR